MCKNKVSEGNMLKEKIGGFKYSLKKYEDGKYGKTNCVYIPDAYGDYRYILWNKGKKDQGKTLIIVGVNPSTATPEKYDSTMNKMFKIAEYNNFNSVIVLNLYPQRIPDPDQLHENVNMEVYNANIEAFKWAVDQCEEITLCAAWGNLIEKRSYLKEFLLELVEYLDGKKKINWKRIGKLTKKGHPRHPLYQKNDSEFENFNMEKYVEILR